ncbi:M24 family metallopeptidase C-terminal domain-containing protein [Vibrio galatheae]
MEWLNRYSELFWRKLSSDLDDIEKAWLKRATETI